MQRVLLVGAGPLPSPSQPRLSFPQLRVDGMRRALLEAGHSVFTLLIGHGEARDSVNWVDLERSGWEQRARELSAAFEPTVVVTAGPFGPARLGVECAGEHLPLLVDVPGDPFAEAQAKQAQDPASRADLETHLLWRPVLARGDCFLAISRSQQRALQGQLGLMGRLSSSSLTHRWVRLAPVAYDFGALPGAPPLGKPPGAPLRVLLAGGFNTWLDAKTLLRGLHFAMDRLPGLEVVVTGGGLPGHFEQGYARFHRDALAGPHPERFLFHGWLPHAALPAVVRGCHLGLWMDRPGLEATLGSRTRVLFFSHQGLAVAGTPRSDLSRELATMGLIHRIEMGDAESLLELLVQRTKLGIEVQSVERAQQFLHRRYQAAHSYAELLEWVESAHRTPRVLDREAALAQEVQRLRGELRAVHQSPTWRAAGRFRRLLRGKKGEQ